MDRRNFRSTGGKFSFAAPGFPDPGPFCVSRRPIADGTLLFSCRGGAYPAFARDRDSSSEPGRTLAGATALYERDLNCLTRAGLEDPNSARVKAAKSGTAPDNIRRVIIAGVPDRIAFLRNICSSLSCRACPLPVLVDAPDCESALFDSWGRPNPESWSKRTLPLRLEDFVVTADPWSEAEVVAGLVEQSNAGLCVADAGMIPNHERAIRRKGFLPYDPAGKPLAPFECATLSRLWLAFRANGNIGELRALRSIPYFCTFSAGSRT